MAGQPVSGRKGLFLCDDVDPVGVLLERVRAQLTGDVHGQKQDKRHREAESQKVDRAVKFVALQEVNETVHNPFTVSRRPTFCFSFFCFPILIPASCKRTSKHIPNGQSLILHGFLPVWKSHPEGCHDKPSALRAPSLPACGWAPPAYGRGWPRFAVATFWMNRNKVLRSLTIRFRQPSANNILNVRGGAYGWYNYIIYCQVRSDDSSAIAK